MILLGTEMQVKIQRRISTDRPRQFDHMPCVTSPTAAVIPNSPSKSSEWTRSINICRRELENFEYDCQERLTGLRWTIVLVSSSRNCGACWASSVSKALQALLICLRHETLRICTRQKFRHVVVSQLSQSSHKEEIHPSTFWSHENDNSVTLFILRCMFIVRCLINFKQFNYVTVLTASSRLWNLLNLLSFSVGNRTLL